MLTLKLPHLNSHSKKTSTLLLQHYMLALANTDLGIGVKRNLNIHFFHCLYCCREDIRNANIVVDDPDGVDCLIIDRE